VQGAVFTFAAPAKIFRVWVVSTDAAPTEVIVADGLTNVPDATMPILLLRRRATSTTFVTVLDPREVADPLRAVRYEPGRVMLERSSGTEQVPLR
jgi:hypothetical protein